MIILLIAFIFIALVCRLFYIQTVNGKNLTLKAKSQWLRSLPLNAQRGIIFDRNGAVLAENICTYDCYVRPSSVENFDTVAKVLSQNIGLDYQAVLNKIVSKKASEILIKLQLEKDVALKIIATNTPGIYFSENNKRNYVAGDLLSQVLGYTTIDGAGQTGLELFYNDFLKGVDGKAQTSTDAKGTELDSNVDSYLPAIAGANLTLTLDLTIQTIVENTLNQIMIDHNPKSASIIVMNCNTGEILAMGTKPSFDLNSPPRNDIALLNSLSKNVCITDVYEPGSTFKLLTLAAGLEENLTDLSSMTFCPGYRIVDGQRIKCWKTKGHGSQNLVDCVCNSCNCCFMDLGLKLGTDKLYEYLYKFGIGSKTGVDFFGESKGIMINQKNVKNCDLARIAFGQSVAVTPLQLLTAEAAIVNGGNVVVPYFLKSANCGLGSLSKNIYKAKTTVKNKVISNTTSAKIRFMMKEQVERSNAIAAYVPGYTLGGKTGTAQKYGANGVAQGKYVSSFVGFAPYENPEYIMLVAVDEPSNGVYYGSQVAAPYGKTVFENIFKYKQIPAKNLEEELEKIKPTIVLPDLVGKTVNECYKILESLGLQCQVQGEGAFVSAQYPSKNVMVYSNAVIVVQSE